MLSSCMDSTIASNIMTAVHVTIPLRRRSLVSARSHGRVISTGARQSLSNHTRTDAGCSALTLTLTRMLRKGAQSGRLGDHDAYSLQPARAHSGRTTDREARISRIRDAHVPLRAPRAMLACPAVAVVAVPTLELAAPTVDCNRPQRIIQHGEARSASTFQWYMLCSIMRRCRTRNNQETNVPRVVCSSRKAETHIKGYERFALQFNKHPPKDVKIKPFSVVQKTHQRPYRNPFTHYFTSSYYPQKLLSYALVHQYYPDFVKHPLATVEDYAPVFNLTTDMVHDVQVHLRWWMIIRQCCGYQSSQDQRNRLHGNSMRRHHPYDYDYVNCDVYNLDEVEKAFLDTKLARQYTPWVQYVREDFSSLRDTAVAPGFCNRTNRDIIRGMDFNRRWLVAPPPPPR